MKHSTVGKLIRVTTLFLLALATTLGVAGLGIMAASPVLSQPDGPGGGPVQGPDLSQLDPTSIPNPTSTPPAPLPLPGP
jgi:hypothetical protein